MIVSAFDWESIKTFLNGYGYIFAIVAAALLLILLITIIAAAAHSAKLKRENRKLRERADSDEKRLADIARSMTLAEEKETTPSRNENEDAQKPSETVAEDTKSEAKQEVAEQEEEAKQEEEAEQEEEPETAQTEEAPVQSEQPEQSEEKPASEAQSEPAEEKPKRTPPPPRTAEQKSAAAQKSAATRTALARNNPAQSEEVQNKYTVKYDREKGNWIILKAGNSRPTRRVATKAEAMSIARELAGKSDAALTVHKKDGKFQKQ